MNIRIKKGRKEMSLRFDWPEITVDLEAKREWIHPAPPLYYLYEDEDGMWSVIDRSWDIAVTKKYKRKDLCVRGFLAKARKGEINERHH